MVEILLFLVLVLCFSAFPSFGGGVVILAAGLESFTHLHPQSWMLMAASAYVTGSLLRYFINPNETLVTPYLPVFLWLTAAVGGSCFLSLNPLAALGQAGIFALFLACGYFILLDVKRPSVLEGYFGVLSLLFMIYGLLGAGQFFGQLEDFHQVITGGAESPVYFGAIGAWLLPFWLMNLGDRRSNLEIWGRLGFTLALLTITLASRSGYSIVMVLVAFIACCAVRFIPKSLVYKIVPAVLLLGAAAIGVLELAEDFQPESLRNQPADMSIDLWMRNHFLAIFAFAQHPFTGVGFGQLFEYIQWRSTTFFELPQAGAFFPTLPVFMAETGLFGVLMVLALPIVRLKQSWLLWRQSPLTNTEKALLIAMAVWLLAALIYPIHHHLFSWCILGVLLGGSRDERGDKPANLSKYTYPNVDYKVESG